VIKLKGLSQAYNNASWRLQIVEQVKEFNKHDKRI
jgi:hypothetical protein